MFQLEDELRGALVARGLYEAQTPAFVSEAEGDVRVANPLNTQEPFMRRVVLPSLLRRVEYNFSRGSADVRLFEIATSFQKAGKGEPPREETHLAGALTGSRDAPHWSRPAEPLDVWDLKGLLEEVASRAYRGGATVAPATSATGLYEAGLAFVVRDASGRELGTGGHVRDGLVDAPVWAGPVWGFEIVLPAQVTAGPAVAYRPLPQYPAVERDLALVVPDALAAGTVLDAVRERAGELLEDVRIFDVYRGQGLPEGTRSVAIRLRFRAPERTLKDKEVDRVVQGVLGRLKEELGVQARG
jgi:phenylalanyl-tRNA synthetase beta chain